MTEIILTGQELEFALNLNDFPDPDQKLTPTRRRMSDCLHDTLHPSGCWVASVDKLKLNQEAEFPFEVSQETAATIVDRLNQIRDNPNVSAYGGRVLASAIRKFKAALPEPGSDESPFKD